jgi:hypothetical protein
MIAALSRTGDRPNVRLMEALLARGAEWEVGVVVGLNFALAGGPAEQDAPLNPLWLAVLAGLMRAKGAVPGLLRMLRAVAEHDVVAQVVAAEALARIGGPAVDGLSELARDGEWWQRVWAYASLAWNSDPRAGEVLRAALAEEVKLPNGTSLADVVVMALADRSDDSVVPALLEALRTCEPSLRGEVEDAIRALHGGKVVRLIDFDWRLRYRMDPEYGFVDGGWPASVLISTEDDGTRPRLTFPPPPVRTLAEILAQSRPVFGVRVDPDGNPLCRCCDAPMWISTNVWVCPATAMTVAWIQDRWLARAREDFHQDDLFDVFDILEDEHHAILEGPRPASPWDQDEVEPLTEVAWAWRAVEWLIEQGVQDVPTGGERIRKEAEKLVALKALTKRAREKEGWLSPN